MSVRCKFKLNSVTTKLGSRNVGGNKYEQCEMYDAEFSAVYSPDEGSENKAFWDATPGGKLTLTTIKQMPWTLGKDYYLDISEAT